MSGSNHHDRTIDILASDDLLIASKDSLGRNIESLDKWLKGTDEIYLVVDEAHHSTAKTYRKIIDYVHKKVKNTKLIGLTATPFRTEQDEQGLLAKIYSDGVRDGKAVSGDIGITQHFLDKVKDHFSVFDGQEVSRHDFKLEAVSVFFQVIHGLLLSQPGKDLVALVQQFIPPLFLLDLQLFHFSLILLQRSRPEMLALTHADFCGDFLVPFNGLAQFGVRGQNLVAMVAARAGEILHHVIAAPCTADAGCLDAERCAAAVTLYKVGHSPYSFLHSWNALQWSSQVLQHLSHSG